MLCYSPGALVSTSSKRTCFKMSPFGLSTMVVRPAESHDSVTSRNNDAVGKRMGRPQFKSSGSNESQTDEVDTIDMLLHEDSTTSNSAVAGIVGDSRSATMDAELSSTPSRPIAMSPSASRSRSRQKVEALNDIDMVDATPLAANLTGKAKKRRKRAGKNATTPALSPLRGVTRTPLASGDEDSDYSLAASDFRKRDFGTPNIRSVTSSPFLRPSSACGGISALRQQLDALDLEPVPGVPSMIRTKSKLGSGTPSSNSVSSETASETDVTEMTSYEVNLEHDFVSCDISKEERTVLSQNVRSDIHRKMTAADFEPLTCLGKGTYGTVHLVKQVATGRLYAQKQFRKASLTVHKRLIEQTKTERVILESINRHPFVVKLYYAFQDHEKLYLILEYAQGGELFTHLATERMFPQETAAFYMAEMVLALEHLHQNVGVLYRDLKPENCLLDAEGHLLLTDFGLSKVALDDATPCNSFLGTIEYMAPEVILGHNYGTAVDWWSFGALGFDLLTGSPPFRGGNHAKIQQNILKQKLVLPYFLGPDAKDLLTRLLRKEPNKRLGADMPKDLLAIKKHRLFRKIDWKALERRELDPPIKPLITDPELAENFSSDFTELAISPLKTMHDSWASEEANPFGGFSFVASKSMLESGGWNL